MARIAVKGTQFEDATESFKGVTAIAWTDGDPVVLSKAISKFMKDNADIYTFKSGVIDGKLVDLAQLTTIANLPSKEELISKLLWVINSSAQGLVTVINAVPRDLAVVIKEIGEAKPAEPVAAAAAVEEPVAETAPEAEVLAAEDAPAVEEAPVVEAAAEEAPAVEAEAATVDAPALEVEAAPAEKAPAVAEEEVLEAAPNAEAEEKAE